MDQLLLREVVVPTNHGYIAHPIQRLSSRVFHTIDNDRKMDSRSHKEP